ncbi:MAG: CBS domain-containing protein [Desulfuromonadales bacterium]|jgi:CBS domain-containing protein|nr:CBS domain-containing protein [Desulfuromonadales bacterium]
MNVGVFCTREVVVIGRDATILEAARLMRRHHVGDVIVVEVRGNINLPIGILTDRDIVVELLAKDVDLSLVSAGDAMSLDLHCVKEEDDLLETMQFMRHRGIRRVPVVGLAGELIGIITLDDMIEVISEQMTDLVQLLGREHQIERERRV